MQRSTYRLDPNNVRNHNIFVALVVSKFPVFMTADFNFAATASIFGLPSRQQRQQQFCQPTGGALSPKVPSDLYGTFHLSAVFGAG